MTQPIIEKTILEEYAQLKAEEKRVAERIKEIAPGIREAMSANDTDKIQTEFGSFSLSSQTRWQYSDAISELQEQEKANGIAKRLISTVLRFTAPKKA